MEPTALCNAGALRCAVLYGRRLCAVQHRSAARAARCIAKHPHCTAPLAPSRPPPKGASNDAPHDPPSIPGGGCGNVGSLNPELGSQKSNNRNQRGAPTPLTSPRPPPMPTAPPPGHEGGRGVGVGRASCSPPPGDSPFSKSGSVPVQFRKC